MHTSHVSASPLRAGIAGLAGSVVLTAVHEGMRHLRPDAPRMDVIAGRALTRSMQKLGLRPPAKRGLYVATLVGDVASNAIYYASLLVGPRQTVVRRAALGGLTAGVGALVVPPRIGLGNPPHAERRANRVMTVAWYMLGALTAAGVFAAISRRRD